jgi:hypothetical protein
MYVTFESENIGSSEYTVTYLYICCVLYILLLLYTVNKTNP